MLDEEALDAATAARVRAIAAASPLTIMQVYGSAEGRIAQGAQAVVIERGGRHAWITFDDRMERWNLDTIACIASQSLSREARGQSYIEGFVGERDNGFVHEFGPLEFTARVEPMGVDPASGRAVYQACDASGAALWRTSQEGPWWCSPDGRVAVRVRAPSTIEVFEAMEGALTLQATASVSSAGLGNVRSVRVHVRSRRVAVDAENGLYLGRRDGAPFSRINVTRDRGGICEYSFTDDGSSLVVLFVEDVLRVDVETLEARATPVAGHPLHPALRAFDRTSGRVVYVSHLGHGVCVVDADAPAGRMRAADPVGRVVAVVPMPDRQAVATLSSDGALRIRSRGSSETRMRAETGPRYGAALAVAPDGRELFVAEQSEGLTVWEVASANPVVTVPDAGYLTAVFQVFDVAVSRDGRYVALQLPCMASVGLLAIVVDLASGKAFAHGCAPKILWTGHKPWPPSASLLAPNDWTKAAGIAFDQRPAWIRAVVERTQGEATLAECVARSLVDDDVETLLRWPIERRGAVTHHLSLDGQLVWRIEETGETVRVSVSEVGASGRLAFARWESAGKRVRSRAGAAVLVVDMGNVRWLLARNGRAVRAPWAGASTVLAVAPDDSALWIVDASGILVELEVPAVLREAPVPPCVEVTIGTIGSHSPSS